MKFQIKSVISVLLALVLITSWATSVFAGPLSQGSVSVSPNLVFNDVATTITITGTGFVSGAVVSLVGFDALSTSYDSDTQLRAVVRPGVPANNYTVLVTNPDGTVFQGSLTVADPSPLPTATSVPTATSAPTVTPPAFSRPQLVIGSYKANVSLVRVGENFKLNISFDNAGTTDALNVQATFTSADLIPTKTGGVVALGGIPTGGHSDTSQTFLAVDSLYGKSVAVIDATLAYYDDKGTAYSDKFTLSLPASGGSNGVVYPTSTPTGVKTAQLVITAYQASVDPLQPGETFELAVNVQNMGNTAAKSITMIVGGGSSGGSSGTPQPGGVSGGGGEFTNFAPVGASNIQSLGDISAGAGIQVKQNLIVNVSTAPGAYPMKITFSYVNDKGEVINDDQVITLLVYSLPRVDLGFYRSPDVLFAGQPNALPIQAVNLGKRTAVLGNMTITTDNGMLETDTTLVGSLDAGGYFTFDASVIPDTAGPLNLTLTIEYTDDFNQPRTITKTLDLVVEESFVDPSLDPSMESGGGGGVAFPTEEETFLQKAWRFVLGLFGLDSYAPENNLPVEGIPSEEFPVPVQPGGGGKG